MQNFIYTETNQLDFQDGILNNVIATSEGNLELNKSEYSIGEPTISGGIIDQPWGPVFWAHKSFIIKSFKFRATRSGNLTFELRKGVNSEWTDISNTTLIEQKTVGLTGGQINEVTLNWEVPADSTDKYWIGNNSLSEINYVEGYRDTSKNNFPYTDSQGAMEIITEGNYNDGNWYNGGWYNLWDIKLEMLDTIGYRISSEIDYSGYDVSNSNISWNENLNGQTINIYTSVDNKATWNICSNNSAIPNIANTGYLYIKEELQTTNLITGPQLEDLTIELKQIPTINILNYTKDKISDEAGYQTSTVTFQSDQDLTEWEARADGTSHGSGLLVGSGTTVSANTDVTFDVDYTELTLGDKTYQINVYGKNSDGLWSG